jgi:uncharacterized protein YndB with AHSA1/START domain
MASSDIRPVGLTQDVGYEIGVRRTLPLSLDAAWRLLTSAEGLGLWLGDLPAADFAPDAAYRLADGTRGEIRVFKPGSHVRLTWQPPGWARPSTIQVRVLPSGARTAIAFHQEHLPDGAAREARRAHFAAALDGLAWLIGLA